MMNGMNSSWKDDMNYHAKIWGLCPPFFLSAICSTLLLATVKKLTRQKIDSRAVKKLTGTLMGFLKICRSGFAWVAPFFAHAKKYSGLRNVPQKQLAYY